MALVVRDGEILSHGEGPQVVPLLKDNLSSEMLQAEKYLKVIQNRGERHLPLERVYHNMRQRDLFIWRYLNLSDYEIVETMGAQIRGLANYYSLALNIGAQLSYVRWVCMESARKTLAAKHKIRSRSTTCRKVDCRATTPDEWQPICVVIERGDKPPLVAKCGETPL